MTPRSTDNMSTRKVRRRRARVVCYRCHEKKIKCDLQAHEAPENPLRRCTHCAEAGGECRLRPSRRNLHHKRHGRPSDVRQTGTSHSLDPNAVLQLPVSRVCGAHLPWDEEPFTSNQPRGNNSLIQASISDSIQSSPSDADTPDVSEGMALVPSASTHVNSLGGSAKIVTPDSTDGHHHVLRPQTSDTQPSYLGESGYMPIFSQEHASEGVRSSGPITVGSVQVISPLSPGLQECYWESFLEYCYTWCPILDRQGPSALVGGGPIILQHALAVVGSLMRPPITQHDAPSSHYQQAKLLFYGNHEPSPLIQIISVMLFYWWSARSPTVVSMDSAWWWTGVAIRRAQEIGLHREPKGDRSTIEGETHGLRRRIWWTLFARERLTAICQGRPCMIDTDDCDVRPPSIQDFPDPEDIRATIFIHWVGLCDILGRVRKYLNQRTGTTPMSLDLFMELRTWIHSLPSHLNLPFATQSTVYFRREVHQLHLPYLASITILHLSESTQSLPKAYTAGILAASCVARIFEDLLARGSLHFLQGMDGWYIAIAMLALLHARRTKQLSAAADRQIDILRLALKEMARRWHSSKLFDAGFERLLGDHETALAKETVLPNVSEQESGLPPSILADPSAQNGVNFLDYFPYATAETTPLFSAVMADTQMPFMELDSLNDLTMELHGLFDPPFDDFNLYAVS